MDSDFGKILMNDLQKVWAESVKITFPNQQDRGAHVNVSGMALTKYAKNKKSAIKLMEYLTGNSAQNFYSEINLEYPVKKGVRVSKLVASWGEFKADNLAMSAIAGNRQLALKMLDEVKFDL